MHRDTALVFEQTVAIRLLDRPLVTAAAALVGLEETMYRPGLGQLTEIVLAGASS